MFRAQLKFAESRAGEFLAFSLSEWKEWQLRVDSDFCFVQCQGSALTNWSYAPANLILPFARGYQNADETCFELRLVAV